MAGWAKALPAAGSAPAWRRRRGWSCRPAASPGPKPRRWVADGVRKLPGEHVEHRQLLPAHHRRFAALAKHQHPRLDGVPLELEVQQHVGIKSFELAGLDVEGRERPAIGPHAVAGIMLLEQQQVAAGHPAYRLGDLVAGAGGNGPGDIRVGIYCKVHVGQGRIGIDRGLVTRGRPHRAERAALETVLRGPGVDALGRGLIHLFTAGAVVDYVRLGGIAGREARQQLAGR